MKKYKILIFVLCIISSILFFTLAFTYNKEYLSEFNTEKYDGTIEDIELEGNAGLIKFYEFDYQFYIYNLNYASNNQLAHNLNTGDPVTFTLKKDEDMSKSLIIVAISNGESEILTLEETNKAYDDISHRVQIFASVAASLPLIVDAYILLVYLKKKRIKTTCWCKLFFV